MFHLIWYILVGLVAGALAKFVMHEHMTILWKPSNSRFHPAGLIFSTLGAILVLYACHKLKIQFPHI